MKPKKLDFDDYDVCFTVPRKVSDPTPLTMEDDYYDFLLKNIGKCMESMDKTASGKIILHHSFPAIYVRYLAYLV